MFGFLRLRSTLRVEHVAWGIRTSACIASSEVAFSGFRCTGPDVVVPVRCGIQ